MADQIPDFIDGDTNLSNRVDAEWLNDVNKTTYRSAVNVKHAAFGAVGDGVTDDRAAILAATLAAASVGGQVDFPAGNYLMGSTLALTSSHANAHWNLMGATIKKGFNGDLVTITNCTNFSIDGMGIIDGVMTSFTGKGFVLSGASSSYFYIGSGILTKAFAGTHVEYGADAGFSSKLMCDMLADASQATPTMITCTGLDTTAMQRIFTGRVIGTISLTGALATYISCPLINQVTISSTCSVTIIVGVSWSNNGNPITIDGANTIVMGCRMAGAVTINSTANGGAYIGNRQTAGSFTNNSTSMMVYDEIQAVFPPGTAAIPGFSVRGDPDTGFWQRTANVLTASVNGSDQFEFSPAAFGFGSGVLLKWGNALTISGIGAFDAGIAKKAAGVLQINNGTLDTLKNLQLAAIWSTSPRTGTGATDIIVAGDTSFIANVAGTMTLTLETASTVPGKLLLVKTITANTVVSASSNVVPRAGGAAGTAILPATDGAWALLHSDGTNWELMAGTP